LNLQDIIIMKSFFGGKKAPEPVEKSIKVNRSDDAAQDLNAILASADIAGIINSTSSAPADKPRAVEHEEDHGKISLTRSDGVNHCIINVFKGVSDAKGETMMRTSISEASSGKISLSKALSSSAIANLRSIGSAIPLSVRIVHMSDTSNFLTASNPTTFIPKGDILVHSGNFTVYGAKKEFEQFNVWLGTVANDFKYRIVTLGCRDVKEFGNNWDVMRSLLANATHVLCHESATVLGIRFYACPWHWGHHKNYVVRKGAPASTSGRFDEIPEDTQVLITHGAAAGVLDTPTLCGSKELGEGIRRTKPALHLHGHSKGAHGVVPAFARYPLVVNSALCDADSRVMYACAHVVKATQIGASDSSAAAGVANWNFAMDSLM
jgi:hypothetical protein